REVRVNGVGVPIRQAFADLVLPKVIAVRESARGIAIRVGAAPAIGGATAALTLHHFLSNLLLGIVLVRIIGKRRYGRVAGGEGIADRGHEARERFGAENVFQAADIAHGAGIAACVITVVVLVQRIAVGVTDRGCLHLSGVAERLDPIVIGVIDLPNDL